jgi:hypothetical protein
MGFRGVEHLVGELKPDRAGEWLRVHRVGVPLQHARLASGESLVASRRAARDPDRSYRGLPKRSRSQALTSHQRGDPVPGRNPSYQCLR